MYSRVLGLLPNLFEYRDDALLENRRSISRTSALQTYDVVRHDLPGISKFTFDRFSASQRALRNLRRDLQSLRK
jgi:hypothetical protein